MWPAGNPRTAQRQLSRGPLCGYPDYPLLQMRKPRSRSLTKLALVHTEPGPPPLSTLPRGVRVDRVRHPPAGPGQVPDRRPLNPHTRRGRLFSSRRGRNQAFPGFESDEEVPPMPGAGLRPTQISKGALASRMQKPRLASAVNGAPGAPEAAPIPLPPPPLPGKSEQHPCPPPGPAHHIHRVGEAVDFGLLWEDVRFGGC